MQPQLKPEYRSLNEFLKRQASYDQRNVDIRHTTLYARYYLKTLFIPKRVAYALDRAEQFRAAQYIDVGSSLGWL